MTRENKLALIVAFALILGVSVLLSDHLSSARTAEPGQVRETSRLPSVPQRPIRTLDDVVRDSRMASNAATPPGQADASTDPNQPLLLASDTDNRGSSGSGLPNLSQPTLLEDFLDAIAGAPSALSTQTAALREPLDSQDAGAPLVLNQRLSPRDQARPAGSTGPAGSPAAASGEPVLTEPLRHHAVRQGESLYAIAARYYGNGNLWRDLARHNTGRVKPDGTVNVGVSLRIPSRTDLTGRPAQPGATPAATPASEPRPPAPTTPAPPARPRTYTVASGDTLGEISMETLGTSRRWREIYELNRDRIPDPDNVRSGLVLKIPS